MCIIISKICFYYIYAYTNIFNFNIKNYVVDSGYLTLDIKKYFIDNNIFGVFGYRRYETSESRKEKRKYEYVKEEDIFTKNGMNCLIKIDCQNLEKNYIKEEKNM